MKALLLILFIVIVVATNNVLSQSQNKENFCVSKEEKEMLKLINDYRKTKRLPAISLSPELTKVAKIHAKDLETNHPDVGDCNMHSWSDKGNWKPCCYTEDHKNAALMWSKPAELTNYKAEGFEIAYESSDEAKPTDALEAWKKSPGHNNVITEKSIFSTMHWKAIGIAVEGNYILIWFGADKDTEPALPDCK